MKAKVLILLSACVLCLAIAAQADGRIMAKVSSIEGKTVYLDKGSSDGLEPGMLFDIYREAKVVFVPTTKEKVLVEEKVVGQVIVTQVSARSSTCHVDRLNPGMEIGAGDTAVRVNPKLAADVNAPPVVESIEASPPEAYAGEEVEITCSISDVNDDFHIFAWSCSTGQLSAEESVVGRVRWTCPADAGTAKITVTVTDPYGAKTTHAHEVKALGPGPRGKKFRPTASFGESTPRFRKVVWADFDSENHLLLLDALEKKIITLSDDFNILHVSAFFGEERSFTSFKLRGPHIYAADSRTGSVIRYSYEGDIFRRKPEAVYGARGSGNGYFRSISDIEVAPDGSVYVLDGAACTIHVFSHSGHFNCSIGRRGDKPGEMHLPTSMTMDSQGNLYIGDFARRKILKFGPANQFITEFDLDRKLGAVIGLRYDRRSDSLIVLERQPHTVRAISTKGEVVREMPTQKNILASIGDPERLAVSLTGEVFLVCQNGEVLKRYSAQGEFLGKMGGENFSQVSNFAVTPEGGLYLMEAAQGIVWHIDRNGWTVSRFGGIGPSPGQFQTPVALCSDNSGRACVLDRKLCKISRFEPDGKFLGTFGKPGSGKDEISNPIDLYRAGELIYCLQYRSRHSVHVFSQDGRMIQIFPDKESETSRPSQIAVDKSGNSFIFTKSYAVEFFNRDGAKLSGVRNSTDWISDLAVDIRGDVFGTCPTAGAILRINPRTAGAQWKLRSTPAAAKCSGIEFDKYGRMYLFDESKKVIVRLTEEVR